MAEFMNLQAKVWKQDCAFYPSPLLTIFISAQPSWLGEKDCLGCLLMRGPDPLSWAASSPTNSRCSLIDLKLMATNNNDWLETHGYKQQCQQCFMYNDSLKDETSDPEHIMYHKHTQYWRTWDVKYSANVLVYLDMELCLKCPLQEQWVLEWRPGASSRNSDILRWEKPLTSRQRLTESHEAQADLPVLHSPMTWSSVF